jgi:type I restriction enzyme S subunit
VHAKRWVVPDLNVFKNYWDVFEVKVEKLRELKQQSRILSKLRDTLLPQLLSGEMRIPEAEKLVEDLERNGGGNGKS